MTPMLARTRWLLSSGRWRGEDSNLRRQSRQIYSLIPLTAREPLPEARKRRILLLKKPTCQPAPEIMTPPFRERSPQRESNPRPSDYKSDALPAELCGRKPWRRRGWPVV